MSNIQLTQVIDFIEQMSAIDLNALVKHLEARWEVIAGGPIVTRVISPPAVTDPPDIRDFDVVVHDVGGRKVHVIKALRVLAPRLTLREAMSRFSALPATILDALPLAEAEAAREALAEVGARVELVPSSGDAPR